MRRRWDLLRAGTWALLLVAAAACGQGDRPGPPGSRERQSPVAIPQEGLPGAKLQIMREGERIAVFNVEMARTPQQQAKGLMGRKSLEPDAGMIFLNDSPVTTPFFMENTLIPLDIAFWDADRRIFQILQMEPCKKTPCPLYPPDRPYLGALEVNKGALADKGVRVGDEVVVTVTVAG